MSSASSDSQRSGGQSRPSEEILSPHLRPESSLLERVIRQTLDLCQPGESLDPAEMRAFKDVAERHHGRPLELEPVGVELVAAAIGGLCPSKKDTAFWQNLCMQVARTLIDDPASFARLNSFWVRLGGGPP